MPKGTPLDLSSGIKHCPDCKQALSLDKFGKSKHTVHGYQSVCKVCQYIRHKAWVAKNPKYSAKFHRERRKEAPDRYKDYCRKKMYGLKPGEFQAMYDAQGGKCAICRCDDPAKIGKRSFHVDHCHDTGKIRGLLCHNCNCGLGHFRHEPKLMAEGIKYLEISSAKRG